MWGKSYLSCWVVRTEVIISVISWQPLSPVHLKIKYRCVFLTTSQQNLHTLSLMFYSFKYYLCQTSAKGRIRDLPLRENTFPFWGIVDPQSPRIQAILPTVILRATWKAQTVLEDTRRIKGKVNIYYSIWWFTCFWLEGGGYPSIKYHWMIFRESL